MKSRMLTVVRPSKRIFNALIDIQTVAVGMNIAPVHPSDKDIEAWYQRPTLMLREIGLQRSLAPRTRRRISGNIRLRDDLTCLF